MDKKVKILIYLNILLVVLILFNTVLPDENLLKRGLNSIFSGSLSPKQSVLEECQTLEFNGDNKINIMFFSTKEEAKKYSEFFKTIPPFDEHKDNFNFYYIDNYKPECELYQEKALLCYNKDIVRKAASCPHDFITVIGEEGRTIRSSAYMNVMSINSKHSLTVLMHEFGHVFVNLAEEYVPAKLPRNAKNCVNECSKFNIKDGCYEGCSEADYFRSINNGIMRTLSSINFGIFNKKLITDKIEDVVQKRQIGATGFVVDKSECKDQRYYLIEGDVVGGDVSITDQSFEEGCSNNIDSGGYEYILITEEDSAIKGNFNPVNVFTDAEKVYEKGIDGEVYKYDKNFFLKIPTIEKPQNMIIIKDGQVLDEIGLEAVSKERPCKK